jgi:hypothetical protein
VTVCASYFSLPLRQLLPILQTKLVLAPRRSWAYTARRQLGKKLRRLLFRFANDFKRSHGITKDLTEKNVFAAVLISSALKFKSVKHKKVFRKRNKKKKAIKS